MHTGKTQSNAPGTAGDSAVSRRSLVLAGLGIAAGSAVLATRSLPTVAANYPVIDTHPAGVLNYTTAAATTHAILRDDLRTGLNTDNRLDRDPPLLRVSWIAWDSGFRGSGLRPGDEILAVAGQPITRPATLPDLQRAVRELPGGLNEGRVWAALGLHDGSPLALTVRRRRLGGEGWQTLEVTGSVRIARSYAFDGGRPALGTGGPPGLSNDGFDGPWEMWYEQRVRDWGRALDDGWYVTHFDTRRALKDHLDQQPRVDFLAQHYPGAFADATRADWQAVRQCLEGTRYDLPPAALAYRELESVCARRVADAGAAAWQAFLDASTAETVPAFPAPDPFREDLSPVVGKLVVLPPVGPGDWLVNVGTTYLAATDRSSWYFVAAQSPAMRRVFDAQYRYQRLVSPDLDERVALVGRILPGPRMMVANERTVAGLEVEPLAALMGQTLFVDPSVLRDGTSPFAGEDDLAKHPSAVPSDNASPHELLQALIDALKANDQATWNALFADWRLLLGESRPLYYAYFPYAPSQQSEDWIRSRRLVLDKVCDVCVRWVGNPVIVLRADEFAGVPRVEQLAAELEHVGLFDGEYRAFNSTDVHRQWTLERRDGGPWRITSLQGI
jgi:hypothetical protein